MPASAALAELYPFCDGPAGATSIRRCGASNEGKNEPARGLGIFTTKSPAVVERSCRGCRCAGSSVSGCARRAGADARGRLRIDEGLQHRREHEAHHLAAVGGTQDVGDRQLMHRC
jgi:hypothetical protein